MMNLIRPTLWRYTAGEMRRRPGRTLLTLLGIVLGVAAVVAILQTTAATHRAYGAMFDALAGRASLEVVAEGFGGFDPAILSHIAAVKGVKAAVPVIQMPTVLMGDASGVSVLALGVDPSVDHAARDYTLRAGQGLDDKDGVLLEENFARAQGLEIGKSAPFLTALLSAGSPRIVSLPVIGLLEARGAATFNGGAVAFLPLTTAQRLFGLQGRINGVQIVLVEGANPQQIESAIRSLLPEGLLVQPPAARGGLAQDALFSTELGLSSLSVVSLVAGAFVILNSFLMNLGERRKQLAILRALGATRGQVTWLLLREAVLLGVGGTVLGILVGLAFSVSLRAIMEQLLGVTLPPSPWTPAPFLAAMLLGPGMALAATYWPARRAGRRAPLEDLLQKGENAQEPQRRWPSYLGLGLMAAVLLISVGLLARWFPQALIPIMLPLSVSLAAVGCVLAIPLVLKPLTRLAWLILHPFLGIEGRLAFRQLNRQPTRTALTVGVLFICILIGISFGQSLRNNVRDIYKWCDNNIAFDFMVRGIMPDTTLLITAAPLPEDLASQLALLDGVERVDKVSFILARCHGRQIVALPFTVDANRRLPFALRSGNVEEAVGRLLDGEVVLGTALAERLAVHVGDTLTVETRRGPQLLRIAGTTSEYTAGGMALYMEWNKGKELFDIHGVHAFTITAQEGARAQLGKSLQAYCADHGLRLQSSADFRAAIDEAMAGVIGFFWGLVVLVFVVASLGVVNTLTMNVLEQTREIGILRAIAMTRRQIHKMILAQALALGVISLPPGVLLGSALAFLMNRAARPIVGQHVDFYLDFFFVAECYLAALAIAVLAALVPARRAARLQVVQALQYE